MDGGSRFGCQFVATKQQDSRTSLLAVAAGVCSCKQSCCRCAAHHHSIELLDLAMSAAAPAAAVLPGFLCGVFAAFHGGPCAVFVCVQYYLYVARSSKGNLLGEKEHCTSISLASVLHMPRIKQAGINNRLWELVGAL